MNRHERRRIEALGRSGGPAVPPPESRGRKVIADRLAAIDRLEARMNFSGETLWEILCLRKADYPAEVVLEIDAVDRAMGPEGRRQFVQMARSGILPA